MFNGLRNLLTSVVATLLIAGSATTTWAADGTLHPGASTFANGDHNTVTFRVNNLLAEGDQTALSINFASDGASTPAAAEVITAANIALSYGPTTQFAVPYGSGYSGAGIGVPANFALTKIVAPPPSPAPPPPPPLLPPESYIGKYALTINYNTSAGASAVTGDWTLTFTNIAPTNARVVVTMNSGGYLSKLATAGVCGGGSACPSGQTCQGPCPLCPFCPLSYCQRHPWNCVVALPWIPKWEPWPLPWPCLSCPPPWKEAFDPAYDRTLVTFVPLNREGRELGPGQIKQIKLNVAGGQLVGGLVDLGEGEYGQMLAARKGEPPPRLTADIAGRTSTEFVAGPPPAAKPSRLPILLALLIGIVLGVGVLLLRSRGAAGQKG